SFGARVLEDPPRRAHDRGSRGRRTHRAVPRHGSREPTRVRSRRAVAGEREEGATQEGRSRMTSVRATPRPSRVRLQHEMARSKERVMIETIAEKMKTLKTVIATVEKQFGKGAMMQLGDSDVIEPIATIPTGSIALDLATGVGGYPRGRVVEIYGPESSG